MKKTIIGILVIAVLAITVGATLWLRGVFKEDTILQNHRRGLMWEKSHQKQSVVAKKIATLDTMAAKLEKKVGKIEDLHIIKQEYLPSVIQYRFEKCLDGSREEGLDQLSLEVEVSIGLVLFAGELLKDDQLSSDYLTFQKIARDKTSREIETAHMAAQEQLKEMMPAFRQWDENIKNLTWDQIPAHQQKLHQQNWEALDRGH